MHFEEGFPVTFRRVGDKLMVNATQITMHFGKIPSEWLRIASTDMLRREMAGNGHTREIRVASLHHTGAGARCDLVGITACHTVGQMDRP